MGRRAGERETGLRCKHPLMGEVQVATTIWRGHLAFGLVTFPVRLYRAARAEKVSFRRLYRPAESRTTEESLPAKGRETEFELPDLEPPRRGHGRRSPEPPPPPTPSEPAPVFRTHNAVVAPEAPRVEHPSTGEPAGYNEPVSRSELVKGYEYEKGKYVVLEDEELRSAAPETSKEMVVVEFVHMSEIDPIYLETSYFVAPDGPGERPYTLMFEALRETGYVGLAQLAMHDREHVVILRPARTGIIAHTMFYADEVRLNEEYRTDPSQVAPRELDLAKRLIETMVVSFEPQKFKDTYRERVQQMIEAKIEGHRVAEEPRAAKRQAAVVDILAALQKSLDVAKKPAAAAASTGPRKPRSKRAG